MAGRARLTVGGIARPVFAGLVVGVLIAHALALDWFSQQLQFGTALQTMAKPMYTRLLEPQTPVVVAHPAPPKPPPANKVRKAAPAPAPAASAPVVAHAQPEPATPEVKEPPPPVAAPTAEEQVALAPQPAASEPAKDPDAHLDTWPSDTRLNYRLGGRFRSGELYGDGRVQWQRVGDQYQVRAEVDVTLWAHIAFTSQGKVGAEGLLPRVYEEERRNGRRAARISETVVILDNGRTLPRPNGVQDTASQFVDLGHRFATGELPIEVGKTVEVWLARPGGVDLWTYDVVERETLATPKLGPVEAFHLKPRAIPNPRGNISAEIWFAPALQFLPVRIRIRMGENDYVDLLVESIEQR